MSRKTKFKIPAHTVETKPHHTIRKMEIEHEKSLCGVLSAYFLMISLTKVTSFVRRENKIPRAVPQKYHPTYNNNLKEEDDTKNVSMWEYKGGGVSSFYCVHGAKIQNMTAA